MVHVHQMMKKQERNYVFVNLFDLLQIKDEMKESNISFAGKRIENYTFHLDHKIITIDQKTHPKFDQNKEQSLAEKMFTASLLRVFE